SDAPRTERVSATPPERDQPTSSSSQRPVLMRAGQLIGYAVLNSRGEDLGKIEDIMLDIRGGGIAYAIMSYGRVLGVGGKTVAVPWDAMRVSPRQRSFILDVDKASLEQAPALDLSNPPDEARRWWGEEYRPYYESKP